MKIALVQQQLTRSMDGNLLQALDAMDEVAENGADVICFPELQLTPFFPQYSGLDVSEYALPLDHLYVQKMQDKCRQLQLLCIPNFYLQEGASRYDASPVIHTDGVILGVSKMVHIAQSPCFYEQDYYTPSEQGFMVYDTAVGQIGVVICFDRHFPESIRSCVLQGAQLIVIPTANMKQEPMQMFEWELRIAAMQNSVFIAMCNRVGLEGEMDFAGESIVISPDGNVVAKAGDTAQILYADIDLKDVVKAQEARPFLNLRRPEMYQNK
ncbi:carbon-nitrogen hydrolase family protein [Celerinatantimonas sp. YJH-8]|uniref:carbon-nitrogen hydrolase family protein n=1 Tax=Celerinatantimonas sp. YJH-8 TaxID=3228714 RepID=UPI0038C20066